jgi:hypothetical protein
LRAPFLSSSFFFLYANEKLAPIAEDLSASTFFSPIRIQSVFCGVDLAVCVVVTGRRESVPKRFMGLVLSLLSFFLFSPEELTRLRCVVGSVSVVNPSTRQSTLLSWREGGR